MAKVNLTLKQKIYSLVIILTLILGGISYKWYYDRDYSTLYSDGKIIARHRWSVDMNRVYTNIKYSYQRDNCVRDGGRLTASRCYYPENFYLSLNRRLPGITLDQEEYVENYLITRETPYFKYGTSGVVSGKVIEEFKHLKEVYDIKDFPLDYKTTYIPKDNTRYKLIWKVVRLKSINIPDGEYHECVYEFGEILIDLQDDCKDLDKAVVDNKKDRIWFYFYPERGIQEFNVRIVDPPGIGLVNFVSPTFADGRTTRNQSFEVNVSIVANETGLGLKRVKYSVNNTGSLSNYTYYNDSLVLAFNFDNLSALGEDSWGNVTFDISSHQNNGSCRQSGYGIKCNYTDGRYAKAISFNASVYVNLSLKSTLPKFTFLSWIYLDREHSSDGYILDCFNDAIGTPSGFFISINSSDNKLVGSFADGTTDVPGEVSTTSLDLKKWYHIAVSYDGTTARSYLDGVLNDSKALTYSGDNECDAIGSSYNEIDTNHGNFFNGTIDEPRLWNRTLNETEIYQEYIANLNRLNQSTWYLYVNQSFNATTELSNGTYVYQSCATDSSGGGNCTEQRTIIVDTNLPPTTPIITSPYDGEINTTRTIIFYSTDPEGSSLTYNIYINSTLNITTQTNITVWNGSDGFYNLTMTATDGKATSANSSVITFTMDANAPIVSTIYPTEGLNISSNSIDLNGSATDTIASSLTYYWVINGTVNATTIDANASMNASDGDYNLTLFVSDGLQNGSAQVLFTLDTTPPVITGLGNYSTDNESSQINWSCSVNCNFSLSWYNGSDMTAANLTGQNNTDSFATAWDVLLSSLKPITQYWINLTVWDATGNSDNNDTFSFITRNNTPTGGVPVALPGTILIYPKSNYSDSLWMVDFGLNGGTVPVFDAACGEITTSIVSYVNSSKKGSYAVSYNSERGYIGRSEKLRFGLSSFPQRFYSNSFRIFFQFNETLTANVTIQVNLNLSNILNRTNIGNANSSTYRLYRIARSGGIYNDTNLCYEQPINTPI